VAVTKRLTKRQAACCTLEVPESAASVSEYSLEIVAPILCADGNHACGNATNANLEAWCGLVGENSDFPFCLSVRSVSN
jgi:hypothetical protein